MLSKLCYTLFVLCFCSCGSLDLSVEENVNRVLKQAHLREDLQTREIQGQKKVFHPIDQQLFEGWIVDYHESGELLCLEHYEMGIPSGFFRRWYANGHPESEGFFRDGKEDGVWTLWFENGKKREMKVFQRGILEGLYAWWFSNGQLRAEGNYKEGKKEGIWIHYDRLGKEKNCMIYSKGELID